MRNTGDSERNTKKRRRALYREAINSRIKNEGYGGYYSYTPISSISFSQYSSSLAAFSISDSRPAEISLRIKEDI